jgi:hypothetical protein
MVLEEFRDTHNTLKCTSKKAEAWIAGLTSYDSIRPLKFACRSFTGWVSGQKRMLKFRFLQTDLKTYPVFDRNCFTMQACGSSEMQAHKVPKDASSGKVLLRENQMDSRKVMP